VTDSPNRPIQDWRVLVTIFWVASLVEGLGISQVFALLPAHLRDLGLAEADRLPFIGLFSSLIFVVGMPFVPLWGVWADKYSRKAVIVRSSIVQAIVLVGVAVAREPWQLAGVLLLLGLQLGNTGVMLAGIRDVAPSRRLGTIVGAFGASGPIGFAVGPALAGILIDGLGWSIRDVFLLSAGFSAATVALLGLGSREVRPEVVPTGRTLDLAFGAVRGVLDDAVVRRIFAIFGLGLLANQMARPYVPVLVEGLVGIGPGLASGIALVAGSAALVGALFAPAGGAIGDRIGFRPVLVGGLVVGSVALVIEPLAPSLPILAGAALVFAGVISTVAAMVFGLLATEVPPERRSATLNLVYLPLYAAGIVGPALGGLVVGLVGLVGPFALGAATYLVGAVLVARSRPATVPDVAAG
jgi:MFS family permease